MLKSRNYRHYWCTVANITSALILPRRLKPLGSIATTYVVANRVGFDFFGANMVLFSDDTGSHCYWCPLHRRHSLSSLLVTLLATTCFVVTISYTYSDDVHVVAKLSPLQTLFLVVSLKTKPNRTISFAMFPYHEFMFSD